MSTLEEKKVEEVKEPIEQVTKPAETSKEPLPAAEILKRAKDEPIEEKTPSGELDELKKVNLDDIKDPQARAFVERRVKELESGVNKKFEEIAEKRKELDSKLAESNQPWTPQRIQSLLKDQNFLSSVQELQKTAAPQEWEGSQEQWSTLSPEEKQEFEALRRENLTTRQQVNKLLQTQEDDKLKEKFPGYDSKVVDELQQGLINGTVQATRADLWKVANYEKDVERAYQLGLKDNAQGISDKINAGHNFSEVNVKPSSDVPDDVKKQGIAAILKYRLAQQKLKS